MSYIISLAKQIKGIKIVVSDLEDLKVDKEKLQTRSYPAIAHWNIKKEDREYLFPAVSGYFPSFFKYWKQVMQNHGF